MTLSTRAPENFSLLTWNIDGLDCKNLHPRTLETCRLIEAARVDVVFLQEVVAASMSVIRSKLSSAYNVLSEENEGYFTAILLRKFTVKVDRFVHKSFHARTVMNRGVDMVHCHIGKARLCLINTHLESTKVR